MFHLFFRRNPAQGDYVIGWRSDGTPIKVTTAGGVLDYLKQNVLDKQFLGSILTLTATYVADKWDVDSWLVALGLRGIAGGIEGLTNFGSSQNCARRPSLEYSDCHWQSSTCGSSLLLSPK